MERLSVALTLVVTDYSLGIDSLTLSITLRAF